MKWQMDGGIPFLCSWDEYERVGAYGTVCMFVCVGVHMLVLIIMMSFVCLQACI